MRGESSRTACATRSGSTSAQALELWAGDVGWNEWEEINTLTDASDAVAENFGWPCYEGTPRQPGYDNQNLPICETLYGLNNAVTAPFYTYRHSDQVIPGESCPIGGSIAGLSFAFYGGGPYPAEYDGALFFADYTRRCIWAMERGGTTRPSPSNIKGLRRRREPRRAADRSRRQSLLRRHRRRHDPPHQVQRWHQSATGRGRRGEPDQRRHRHDGQLRRLRLERPQRRSAQLRVGPRR